MSDILNVTGGNYTGEPAEQYGPDVATGALRRQYNFGSKVSELNLASDPFFRFVSMVSKKPTDDPIFKFTERRESYVRRYVYVINHGNNTATTDQAGGGDGVTGIVINAADDGAGDTIWIEVGTDWLSNGNKRKSLGQTETDIAGTGTKPEFLFAGQLLKLPVTSGDNTANGLATTDYMVVKIVSVNTAATETLDLECIVVKEMANPLEERIKIIDFVPEEEPTLVLRSPDLNNVESPVQRRSTQYKTESDILTSDKTISSTIKVGCIF